MVAIKNKFLVIFIISLCVVSGCVENNDGLIAPVAKFSFQIGSDRLVRFTDESLNEPTSWLWEIEESSASSSTDQNPEIQFETYRTFQIKLTVTNEAGSSTTTQSVTLIQPGYYLTKIKDQDMYHQLHYTNSMKIKGIYFHDEAQVSSSNTTGLIYNYDYSLNSESLVEEIKYHNLKDPFKLKYTFLGYDESNGLITEEFGEGPYPEDVSSIAGTESFAYEISAGVPQKRLNYNSENTLSGYQVFEFDDMDRIQKETSYRITGNNEELIYSIDIAYDDKQNPWEFIKGQGVFEGRFQPVFQSPNNPVSFIKKDSQGNTIENESYSVTYTYNESGFPVSAVKTYLSGEEYELLYEYSKIE